MVIATEILNEAFRCESIIFLMYGIAGLLGSVIAYLCMRHKRTDKFIVYLVVLFTVGILCLSFFGVLLPMHKDINESKISVANGTYESRNQRGDQSGIFSTGTVFFTPDNKDSTSFGMPKLFDSTFRPYFFDNYPGTGPLRVRLYYTEHSNLALYMEVIE